MGIVLSFLSGLLGKLLGSLFGIHKDPTPVDLADSNAHAQDQLAEQEAVNAVQNADAGNRIDADARVVRAVTEAESKPASPDTSGPAGVNPTVNEELRKQFPDEFQ